MLGGYSGLARGYGSRAGGWRPCGGSPAGARVEGVWAGLPWRREWEGAAGIGQTLSPPSSSRSECDSVLVLLLGPCHFALLRLLDACLEFGRSSSILLTASQRGRLHSFACLSFAPPCASVFFSPARSPAVPLSCSCSIIIVLSSVVPSPPSAFLSSLDKSIVVRPCSPPPAGPRAPRRSCAARHSLLLSYLFSILSSLLWPL